MITVDCGIGSAEEVAAARAAGIEVIVTDHHEPPASACPTARSCTRSCRGYPFSALCAAGVAHKLALGAAAAPPGVGGDGARTSSTWWRWRPSPTWSP